MTVQFRNVHYTTLDRQDTFVFDFVQVGNIWRAYIVRCPSYNGRRSGGPAHVLHDARGDYVCWEPEPRTLNLAKGAARAWADATQIYIRTGNFPAPAVRHDVPDLSTSAGWVHGDSEGAIPPAQAPVLPRANAPRRAPAVANPNAPRPSAWRAIFRRN